MPKMAEQKSTAQKWKASTISTPPVKFIYADDIYFLEVDQKALFTLPQPSTHTLQKNVLSQISAAALSAEGQQISLTNKHKM